MESSELFDICLQLAQGEPSISATRRIHELLTLTAAEGCRQQGGTFGNLFAQIDWLCQRLGIKASDVQAIHTARRHSNRFEALTKSDFLYDLRAVALLISAVFRATVPGPLLRALPARGCEQPQGLSIDRRYVRCIVRSVSPDFIEADTDRGPIRVNYLCTDQGRDFAYLQKLVRPDMQLNLLDCHEDTDSDAVIPVLTPLTVVVEPDFLVDISSLAACFTPYGHHPLLYTLSRLKPRLTTQSMLLGDFAGVALDALVSHPDATFADMLTRAFRQEPLRYCACAGFLPDAFKRQAQQQIENIRQTVTTLAFSPVTSASADGTASLSSSGHSSHLPLLEPSFVCERLGLQGRVDLMTSDMHLLVEQKSGKNMKIERQSHDSHGLQLESHYVQLLLYYGVLRYNFGLTERQVDMRLLYSRYPAAQGLLTVNYYRTLLREAIRLRNQIVATELLMARDGIGRFLPLLTTDIIYKGITRDGFFHRYIEPGTAQIATRLQQLSPLERTYLERMMTFVYREQACQKLGSSETRLHHSGGCTADLWQMPLAEKIETGNIIHALTLLSQERSTPHGGYDLLTLGIGQTPPSLNADDDQQPPSAPNFRAGDMVYLYAYRDEPDVRQSILYKGTLEAIEPTRVVVRLTNGQQNPQVFAPDDGRLWALEHGGSDVGTAASLRSLWQWAGANASRRCLLLGQRPPEAHPTLTLSRSYHPDYDDVLLRIRQSLDYFLLVGPPGTGKTSMAMRFIVEETLHQIDGGSVLLCAYTNRAVDEISDMLVDAGLPFLRLGNAAACDVRFRSYLLDEAAKGKDRQGVTDLIVQAPIVVATTSMLLQRDDLFLLKQFCLCIVDEASQILEPQLMGLLSRDEIGPFVLIGDHKQLPAVVQQGADEAAVSEQCLRDIGLDDTRQSLFQRLLRWERHEGRTQFVGTLHRQGRMHPLVAQFPCGHFYALEQISAANRPHQMETAEPGYTLPPADQLDAELKTHRVLFLPVPAESRPKKIDKIGENKAVAPAVNPLVAEAMLVGDLLQRIYRFTADKGFDPARTVGVIVPYRSQISLIRQAIEKTGIDALRQISIDTVERYQGSQRDVIIYSFAVSHYFQLDFLTASTFADEDGSTIDRKLNVALTRARRQLIMVGNTRVLSRNPIFRQLISQYQVQW
ncbi:MAG: AAA family ATPase [Prevotella sp.]|nr:AAA family ATPase [Prevotella sp.]